MIKAAIVPATKFGALSGSLVVVETSMQHEVPSSLLPSWCIIEERFRLTDAG
jgi:hypothetical protein